MAGLLNLQLFFKAVVNSSKSSEGGKTAGAVVLQQVGRAACCWVHVSILPRRWWSGPGNGNPHKLQEETKLKDLSGDLGFVHGDVSLGAEKGSLRSLCAGVPGQGRGG